MTDAHSDRKMKTICVRAQKYDENTINVNVYLHVAQPFFPFGSFVDSAFVPVYFGIAESSTRILIEFCNADAYKCAAHTDR